MTAPPAEDISIEQAIRNDLAEIKASVADMRAKLEAFEKLAGSFVTGPGIAKLFKAISGKV